MHLLIPAAGVGKRMGSAGNKLLLPLLGQPILSWTLQAAQAATTVEWIGIVCQPLDQAEIEAMLSRLKLTQPVQLIGGGATRQESVYNGLQSLPDEAQHLLIHDGARCLATPGLFDRCSEALQACDGLIAAIPVKDTIKRVDDQRRIVETPDRARLWAAQTPQGFCVTRLKQCHQQGRARGLEVTDDAALFEACGLPVQIVPGEETNLKVTTPVDLAIAEFILRQRQAG